MTRTKPHLLTFGCRLNTYESEVMRQHAAGLDDVIIVNTCAVTAEAERQARQAIRKAYREKPHARIIVTGCAVQVDPDRWAELPGVVRVVGNADKLHAEQWQPEKMDIPRAVTDIMSAQETAAHLVTEFAERSRAFVQIQQGCNHRCTFCIIPYGRGPSRSVPAGGVIDQVRHLCESGYQEVVITGVDISSWGKDLPGKPTLGMLCKRILSLVPQLPRLRLSSIDPVGLDDTLWMLLAEEPRFMPYLHLSLQAGHDLILKRMKRRHLTEDVYKLVERVRRVRPEVGLGADLISGFPTETEDMFAQGVQFITDMRIPYLHVFPYSEREGTPAAKMPSIAKNLRKERAAALRKVGEENRVAFYRTLVGKKLKILLETSLMGHSEEFAAVKIKEPATHQIGQIIEVVASDVSGTELIAERV